MNNVLKQSIIDLLEAAKAHIKAGETSEATEKIDAVVASLENEGAEPASADPEGEEGKPKDPPLPGQGTNGVNP